MKTVINYIKGNVLIKLASLNSISVLVRIIAGFLTSKAIALYVGAEGLALVGNLRNFVTSAQSVSELGAYNGLVKYVSEYKKKPKQLVSAITSTSILIFIATLLVSTICFLFSNTISKQLFDSQTYSYSIKILALALPFYSLNRIILGVINGFSKFNTIIKLNITGQVLGAIVTLGLIFFKRMEGALIAIAISEALIIIVTLVIAIKYRVLSVLFSGFHVNTLFTKKLAAFSGMALFSAIVLPLVMVFIRNYIIDTIGLKEAGFWEAMNRISNYYIMFMGTLISIYLLPRFSEITTDKAFRKEVFNFYKTLMPLFGAGLIFIYLIRDFIIKLILTEEFKPVEELFSWQLMGDFVKILSVVIASQFVAKRMFWWYIISETISVVLLYFFSIYCINYFGLKGANIAHFFTYIVYYAIILIVFWKPLFGNLQNEKD